MILDLDHWREIGHSLAANRLRTMLTAFGVLWGLFMLVVMLGSGNGLANGITRNLGGTATNCVFIWTERTSKPWRGLPPRRSLDMTVADVEAIRAHASSVELVAPRSQLGGWDRGNNVTRGTKAGGFQVVGATAELLRIQPMRIVAGRFLNPLDLEERRKVAVISSRPHAILFESDEDPVGQRLRINGVDFTVVGVAASLRGGHQAERDELTIYVPFTTFQRAFNNGDRVGWITVLSRPGVAASVAERDVVALLAARHQVAPDDASAFGRWNMETEYERLSGLFTGIRILIWIVGTGTLAAGVIGVSNIMLVIVKERTHEIGIRRAVGATPAAVMGQVLAEAILLTSIAGWLGLCLGVIVLEAAAKVAASAPAAEGPSMFSDPGVDFVTALQALAVLVVAGVIAGVIPARRAVAVAPVEALRSNT